MQRLLSAARVFALSVSILVASGGTALAADRSITLLPGTDLPGFDYAVEKGVTLNACEAACVGDRLCRAFTFNERAGWCFLKADGGPEETFAGATSGRIAQSPTPAELSALRQQDLPFPSYDFVNGAIGFSNGLPQTDPAPEGIAFADLITAGDEAVEQSNPVGAMVSYRQALSINRNDPALWLKLANAALARADAEAAQNNGYSSYDLGVTATYAAINGLLRAESAGERADALAAVAHALERRQMWRESIATYRASVGLVDDAGVQAKLDKLVAERGFRVVSHEVDADSPEPRICAVFSDPLPISDTDLSAYVVVENGRGTSVEPENRQICITGVEHGRRYDIRLRAGLPSADGEQLRSDVALNVYVADRTAMVAFANNAYVMPSGLGGGLPITSVNADVADVAVYRIGDRSIAIAVRSGVFQNALDGYSAEDVATQTGELVWEGQVELARSTPNAMVTTAIPVTEAIGEMQPGAYVITAKVAGSQQDYWRSMATQWFIVSDLGLTTVQAEDGVHAFVRSLQTAEPVADAAVRLVAVNNEILAELRTDTEGRATFAPGLALGDGGRAPQLVVVETEDDYAFLDVSKPGFDLTDRGVDGRPSPGPLDVFATTERGVYRPGETVFVTALLRDARAAAVTGLPLTLEIERPDGLVSSSEVLQDRGAGSYFAAIPLVTDAMRGSWTARLYADPKAEALTSVSYLVEDFEPERLAFEVTAPEGQLTAGEAAEVPVKAGYLYGATAPGLAIEADVYLRTTTTLPGFPGYTFGRTDDTFEPNYEPLGTVAVTGEDGATVAEVYVPEPEATTRPLEAQVYLRLVDTNGRTVQRSFRRPVMGDLNDIGIRPRFTSDGLSEGSTASFDIVSVAPSGEAVDEEGLRWTLSRIETNYQWYRDGGVWRWEAVTTTRQVAAGEVDAAAANPVTVSAPVDWGRYLFEIQNTADYPSASSFEFYAGYYYAEAGSDTPDKLQVALDKPAYRVGETATLRLDPQFAGTALVMVMDDRIIEMQAVEVPAEGTTVALDVTDDWGPGAYVTAMLFRPASAVEKRMPGRALGLAFADVDPGDMKLDVALDAPQVTLPRQTLTVEVDVGEAAAGETAYVALAAVDLGILNLTNFQVPDPDGWYFGQRALGAEFRDLYGRLIDPTQGMAGALRSGGDGGGSRLGTPPATSVLVALHSGIVTVNDDGKATVSFDIPDFAGTVRVMAMAWTENAVGHAHADVLVRDPVVVTLSPPRFLRLEDTSRLLVEVNNVDGPAGAYKVELFAGTGIVSDARAVEVTLAEGERTVLNLGLTGTAIGDNEMRLIVTDPSGNALVKALTLGVRAASAPQTESRLIPLRAGETVTFDGSEFAGMVPHTGSLTLAIGPLARLDVPGVLLALDRYPFGCVEQVSSRAMPLLYLNDVATMIGMATDDGIDQRIEDAIADVLSKQNYVGGFGLWGPGSSSDPWLDAYVTEFLLRAKDKGYAVPELALTRALDNLGNQVSYATDFSSGGEALAYALYDLARAGRATIGDLRYYVEARLDAFATPLAKAQLAAALALYGDRTRAATAFQAAVEMLAVPEPSGYRYRADYGSRLRDAAGVLALAAEFRPGGVDIGALSSELQRLRDVARYTSTQEDAWTLLAAATLGEDAASGAVSIDGVPLTGDAYRRYPEEDLARSTLEVTNTANQPTEIKVSVTAIPSTPPAAMSNGFEISRGYHLVDGTPADLGEVNQNDRFVVVLSVTQTMAGTGQYVVSDPLPAGFEIDNPDLTRSAGAGDLSWLSLSYPAHVESRTDQYVAAFRYGAEMATFTTAYIVRAVSPGDFVHPGAVVEDMYRPELRANTEAGQITVAPAGQ